MASCIALIARTSRSSVTPQRHALGKRNVDRDRLGLADAEVIGGGVAEVAIG